MFLIVSTVILFIHILLFGCSSVCVVFHAIFTEFGVFILTTEWTRLEKFQKTQNTIITVLNQFFLCYSDFIIVNCFHLKIGHPT